MIGHEFYKLIKNSVLLPILAVSLLINGMLLIYYCNERAELYTNNEVIAEQHKILVNSYSDDIDDIILHAQNNLKEFDVLGFSNSDYNVKYQHFVIKHYSAIRDTIEFSSQPVSGWDIYFSYRTGDIFILCFLLLASILIFTTDHITGMYHIVYTTKNGRMKTAVSKIILTAIVSFAVSIIFVVEQLIIVGAFFSFSQPFAAIQNIVQFYLCPFQITIIQLFIVSLFLKCLASYMFCMVIETISAFLSHYVVIYLSGLGFLCLNIVLYSITYVNKENLLNTTNIINAMNALLYYERVHTADFFNRIIPLQKYVTVLYSVFHLSWLY